MHAGIVKDCAVVAHRHLPHRRRITAALGDHEGNTIRAVGLKSSSEILRKLRIAVLQEGIVTHIGVTARRKGIITTVTTGIADALITDTCITVTPLRNQRRITPADIARPRGEQGSVVRKIAVEHDIGRGGIQHTEGPSRLTTKALQRDAIFIEQGACLDQHRIVLARNQICNGVDPQFRPDNRDLRRITGLNTRIDTIGQITHDNIAAADLYGVIKNRQQVNKWEHISRRAQAL